MVRLTLDDFLSAGSDTESARYRILAALKTYKHDFDTNCLYPGLTELIELKGSLNALLQGKTKFQEDLPQTLKEVDLVNKTITFEPLKLSCAPLDDVIEIVQWALPLIDEAITVGTHIYDFVEENVTIKVVGIMPLYLDEGYWFVPDNKASLLHLLHFSLALYESGNERFRSLKTEILKTLQQTAITKPAESMKMELMEEHHEIPNPATFVCETGLDFPFKATMLPVAKRKLLLRLAA